MEKYYKYRLKNYETEKVKKEYSYLNVNWINNGKSFMFSDDTEMHEWRTIFKENDPLLKFIDLSWFDKIEVEE